MTKPAEQLREAFETHENLAPDPGAVLARVQQLSRKYQRRRRGAQVAGAGMLGAGLIAGAVHLPSFLPGSSAAGPGIGVGAAPSPQPSVAASYSDLDRKKDWAAYFAAGYGYDDAVKLAAIWHSNAGIGNVKAEAGRRLLAGETLPIKPTGNSEPPSSPLPSSPDPSASADEAARQAFFDAGYVWDDAVRLTTLWHLADPADAKVKAGKKIEAHQPLPFRPQPANVQAARDGAAEDAFFKAGYDGAAADKLAKLWHVSRHQAKILGGRKLLAGETLPVRP